MTLTTCIIVSTPPHKKVNTPSCVVCNFRWRGISSIGSVGKFVVSIHRRYFGRGQPCRIVGDISLFICVSFSP